MSSQSIIKLKQNTSVSNHVRFKTTVGWFEIQNFKLIYKIPTQKQNSNMKLHVLNNTPTYYATLKCGTSIRMQDFNLIHCICFSKHRLYLIS